MTVEPAKIDFIDDDETTNEGEANNDDGNNHNDGLQQQQQEPQQPAMVEEDRYKNLQAAFTRASQDNASLKNQLAEMQAKIEQLSQQQAQPQQQAQQPAQQQFDYAELDKSASEFDELRPIVDHVKKMEAMLQQTQEKLTRTEQELARTKQETTQQTQMTAQEIHNQRILSVHPDAFDVAGTPDFHGWLLRQPGYVQQVMQTGSADDVITVLSSYKQAMGVSGQQQQQQPQQHFQPTAVNSNSAVTVNTDKTKQAFTRAQIEAMSEAEFLANEDAINEAMVAGLIR